MSEQDTSEMPVASAPPRTQCDGPEEDKYTDRSFDLVARVRAAKAAAQREMESFGDVSEYDVTVLRGQKQEGPVQAAPGASPTNSSDEER
ncbi:MAG: hypothetical protein ACYDBH_19640 [Acidobacteriaceae bacterium]